MKEQLPLGWIQTCLGDVCLPVSKHQPNNQPDKEITYLDIGGIDSQTHSISEIKRYLGAEAPSRARQLVQTGDTLFSTVRVYLEKIALVPDPLDGSTASTGFCVLRPSRVINPRFLYFRVLEHTFIEELSTKQTGTSYPAVRDKDIFAMGIHLPPLSEQKRITDAIEEHFSRIDAVESAAQTALAKLDTLRRTVLTAAFSGRLVDQDPDDEPASILLERIAAEGPQRRTRRAAQIASQSSRPLTEVLPYGWAWANFGSIAQTQLGKMLSEKSKTGVGSRPYLRNKNVQWHRFDLRDIAQMDFSDRDQAKYEVQPGDLLVCEGGEVGRCATWLYPAGEMYFQKALHRVRPHHAIQVKWLEYFLRWSAETDRFAQHTSGSTISHIPQRDLRQLSVPTPPSSEQVRIVAIIEEHFSRIDMAKASLERCLQRCGVLRRSVLAAAFSGRLVDQDPNDEPASVLLEQIAAEQPKPRTRRKSA